MLPRPPPLPPRAGHTTWRPAAKNGMCPGGEELQVRLKPSPRSLDGRRHSLIWQPASRLLTGAGSCCARFGAVCCEFAAVRQNLQPGRRACCSANQSRASKPAAPTSKHPTNACAAARCADRTKCRVLRGRSAACSPWPHRPDRLNLQRRTGRPQPNGVRRLRHSRALQPRTVRRSAPESPQPRRATRRRPAAGSRAGRPAARRPPRRRRRCRLLLRPCSTTRPTGPPGRRRRQRARRTCARVCVCVCVGECVCV
jgi:hypothetical protein